MAHGHSVPIPTVNSFGRTVVAILWGHHVNLFCRQWVHTRELTQRLLWYLDSLLRIWALLPPFLILTVIPVSGDPFCPMLPSVTLSGLKSLVVRKECGCSSCPEPSSIITKVVEGVHRISEGTLCCFQIYEQPMT